MASIRLLFLFFAGGILVQSIGAQNSQEVIIKEPGICQLADLFKQSDKVVLAKIVAGDTEAYDGAIYKAEVVKSFKGSVIGDTIYFGHYVGERLGWEYVLFLRNVPQSIVPKKVSVAGYGTVHYSEVFNEGYSSMMTSYECVFDGNEIAQKCDQGVRVCTDYLKIPTSTPAFPPTTEDTPFGCRWVRKSAFISLLDAFANRGK
jgi:hypothetical protein